MSIRLSVLDQSPIISGHSPREAIEATIELARAADRLGFTRYWLAEHHNMQGLADPCPEILLTRIGAETSRIRVGTGGVLLPYYSPLMVAEVFRMQEALLPGRVDLGIGRAPGGDMLTAKAISPRAFSELDTFPQQVMELVAWLDDCLPDEHPFQRVRAMPAGDSSPEVWLLGSSDYSGSLAAYLGLRFAFAHFISARGGDAVSRAYRDDFRPSHRDPGPYSMVCVMVVCAESDAEAERLAASIDHRRLLMATGREAPVATTDEALAYPYSERDREVIRRERERAVIGSPERVKARLLEIQQAFGA
ncbi:MAG TPA: LLM class flavin-dependent oxidoreductase, partial [Burkholderiales bacterium]|nr:LLM class flavin-dependent oxidoreductase [Burkholderiales bacterium]